MANTNSFPGLCVRCGKRVEPGAGKFVGPGRMMHRALCKPPERLLTAGKKKLLALGRAFLAPSLALVVVIGCAAAGSGDYVLVMPEHGIGTGSPAKSLETCEAARRAAWNGWLPDVPAGTPSRCQRAPGAFSERSNCIAGHNCP